MLRLTGAAKAADAVANGAQTVQACVHVACAAEPVVEQLATAVTALAKVKGGAANTINTLESYANSVCGNQNGPNVDANTAQWLGQIQAGIAAAAAASKPAGSGEARPARQPARSNETTSRSPTWNNCARRISRA